MEVTVKELREALETLEDHKRILFDNGFELTSVDPSWQTGAYVCYDLEEI